MRLQAKMMKHFDIIDLSAVIPYGTAATGNPVELLIEKQTQRCG